MTKFNFEDLPSRKTPINAQNLNKLNNVVIQPTIPTTGEEVWIKHSKNLFNKNKYTVVNKAYIQSASGKIESHPDTKTIVIPCLPNTTYTISKINNSIFTVGTTNIYPMLGTSVNDIIDTPNVDSISLTTNNDAKYIVVWVIWNGVTPQSEQQIVDTLQIEYGENKTSYEEGCENTINVYNKNKYEELSFIEDTGWVDISSLLNTQFLSVRPFYTPMIRKIGNVVYLRGEVYIHNSPNNNTIILFNDIPEKFTPVYQATGAGITFNQFRRYNIWTENGTIVANIDDYATQPDYMGFDLSNIPPYIVD